MLSVELKRRLETKLQPKYSERLSEMLAGVDDSDVERHALFIILACNDDLFSKINTIYDFERHEINPDCFEQVDFCSSSRQLLKLGFNLYNDAHRADVSDTFSGLDETNAWIAALAILVRFGVYKLSYPTGQACQDRPAN